MISAPRSAPTLAGPCLSGDQCRDRSPLLGRAASAPSFLVLRDRTFLLAFFRGWTTFGLCTGRRICLANLARGLRVHLAGRQVRKKVAGVAAIVVNCNSIISLSRERIVKLRNKGTVSMWHEGFLNCV